MRSLRSSPDRVNIRRTRRQVIAFLIALVAALAGWTDAGSAAAKPEGPAPACTALASDATSPTVPAANPFAEPARDVLAHAACGNCHRPGLKTSDPRALKIFNLHDPVWYGAMTDDQIRSLKNRIEHSSAIDDGDRAAVLSFVDCKLTGACAPPHPEVSP